MVSRSLRDYTRGAGKQGSPLGAAANPASVEIASRHAEPPRSWFRHGLKPCQRDESWVWVCTSWRLGFWILAIEISFGGAGGECCCWAFCPVCSSVGGTIPCPRFHWLAVNSRRSRRSFRVPECGALWSEASRSLIRRFRWRNGLGS